MLERIRRRREQRYSLLDKPKKLGLERNQVCGEFETLLNSCPEKGIVDTCCAKMMGSDAFQRYLGVLHSKERASIEKVPEKDRFKVWRQRDSNVILVSGHSNEQWRASVS